jgi:DNA polymerase III delta prime subunit
MIEKMTTATANKVIDRIEEFCQVLRTNYQEYSIALHRNYINKEENVDYHIEQINQLAMGEGVDEYTYEKGRKYARIVHITQPSGQRSAHAFVDLNTGDVYKSASWKSPAKGVRYNLLDDKSREEMYKRADWVGFYLRTR